MQSPLNQNELERRLRRMPLTAAPGDLWDGVQNQLRRQPRNAIISLLRRPVKSPLLAAAALVTAIGLGMYVGALRAYVAPASWNVVRVTGAPIVGTNVVNDVGNMERGQWLVTDETSRALISVGKIGTAELGPNSRMRLDSASGRQHRLTLERGSLDAIISAPPRLFFVSTPTTLATDLGCAYTLSVDDTGATRIHVTSGWVELSEKGRRVLVPAGFVATVDVGGEPGTPFTIDLSENARENLRLLDHGRGDSTTVLNLILGIRSQATTDHERKDGAITLWHLVQRLDEDLRPLIVRGMMALSPPPTGVTTEGILALDRPMLERWRSDLRPMWSEEAQPLLIRIARRLWTWTMS